MKSVEVRIPLPFSPDDYRRGQRYMTAACSRAESDGQCGVRVLKSESSVGPNGRQRAYTEKLMLIGERFPPWLRPLARTVFGTEDVTFLERCWVNYPEITTLYSCPSLEAKYGFSLSVHSFHVPGRALEEEAVVPKCVRGCPQPKKSPIIRVIDISDTRANKLGKGDPDPSRTCLTSWPSEISPLPRGWMDTPCGETMTACKLVSCQCGGPFGKAIEKATVELMLNTFISYSRRLYAMGDQWHYLSGSELDKLEEQLYEYLKDNRK